MIDEKEIDSIKRVVKGDGGAFEYLVRKYETRVRGYCMMMLSDRTQAEDTAQDIFVKVYQSLGRFRQESSFSTWLYRITANQCMDVIRQRARRKTESLEALTEKGGDAIEALFSVEPNAERAIIRTEQLADILSCLSEQSREMLIMHEIQGLSYREICDAAGCSLDAVKSRLKRARQEIVEKVRHLSTTTDVSMHRGAV